MFAPDEKFQLDRREAAATGDIAAAGPSDDCIHQPISANPGIERAVGVTLPSLFDTSDFRDRMSRYASGITVIGGLVGDDPAGFTCQSFYSVSSAPPLVSFCVMKSSTSWPRIRPVGRFSVNVLAEGQEHVSLSFARSGGTKWASVDWTLSPAQSPLIVGTLMWLDCAVFAEHEAGDHYIVIGEVMTMSPADWHESGTPLLYFRGAYRHLRRGPDGAAGC